MKYQFDAGKMQSPSHGQVNRSSVLVGNYLEMVPQ